MIRQIGRGSYGEVWLAQNVMGQFRAVKVVYRDRFESDRPYEREFSGIKKFEPVSRRHESQLDLLHVGRNGNYFYYVMELADDVTNGQEIDSDHYAPRTLKHELQHRGRLPFSECLEIALSLATALKHLHGSGLVHRDVKPSNVIFINGRPKLADIGLVADIDATLSYVGTEGYLPPEGPGQATADIYSLGKVLYEINTGNDRKDFPEIPTSLLDSRELERLSELNEVIVKAGESNVQKRYQSADEVLEDLVLLQSQKSIITRRRLERRLLWFRRAAVMALVFGSLAWAGYLYQKKQTDVANQLTADLEKKTEELKISEQNAVTQAKELRITSYQIHDENAQQAMELEDYQEAALWSQSALGFSDSASAASTQIERISECLSRLPGLIDYYQSSSSSWLRDPLRYAENNRYYLPHKQKGSLEIRDSLDGTILGDLSPLRSSDRFGIWPHSDGQFLILKPRTKNEKLEFRIWSVSEGWVEQLYRIIPSERDWTFGGFGMGARYIGVIQGLMDRELSLRVGLFDKQTEKYPWFQELESAKDTSWRVEVGPNDKFVLATSSRVAPTAPDGKNRRIKVFHLFDAATGLLVDEMDSEHESYLTSQLGVAGWLVDYPKIERNNTTVEVLRCWPVSEKGFGEPFDLKSDRKVDRQQNYWLDLHLGPGPTQMISHHSDSIEIFDLAARKSVKTLSIEGKLFTATDLSPDTRRLLSVVDGRELLVKDLSLGTDWQTIFRSKLEINYAKFAFPGDRIFVAFGDFSVRLVDTKNLGKKEAPRRNFGGYTNQLSIPKAWATGKNSRFIWLGNDRNILSVDLDSKAAPEPLIPDGKFTTFDVSFHTNLIATVNDGSRLKVWNLDDKNLVQTHTLESGTIQTLRWSNDGESIAAIARNPDRLMVFNLAEGIDNPATHPYVEYPEQPGMFAPTPIPSTPQFDPFSESALPEREVFLNWSPDDSRLIARCGVQTLILETELEKAIPFSPTNWGQPVAPSVGKFSRAGNQFLYFTKSGDHKHAIATTHTTNRTFQSVIRGEETKWISFEGPIRFANWSPDSRWLLTVSQTGRYDHRIFLFDRVSMPDFVESYSQGDRNQKVHSPFFDTSYAEFDFSAESKIHSIAFDANSELFATGDESGRIEVWSCEPATQVFTDQSMSSAVLGVTFSPDQRFLVSFHENGEVIAHNIFSTEIDDTILESLQLLTGGVRQPNGRFRPTDPDELSTLMKSHLASRTVSRNTALADLIDWHISELNSSMDAANTRIPLFHVAELKKHQPEESKWDEIENQLTSHQSSDATP